MFAYSNSSSERRCREATPVESTWECNANGSGPGACQCGGVGEDDGIPTEPISVMVVRSSAAVSRVVDSVAAGSETDVGCGSIGCDPSGVVAGGEPYG